MRQCETTALRVHPRYPTLPSSLLSSNKFDLFATTVLFVVGVLWALPTVHVPPEALRYFSILRLLRLLRLLSQVERFGFICNCIWRM